MSIDLKLQLSWLVNHSVFPVSFFLLHLLNGERQILHTLDTESNF